MATGGFICRDDYLDKTAKLSDEQLGRLFRALMVYHSTGEETDLGGIESFAFDFIRVDIDKADQAYKEKCETNRQNRLRASECDDKRSLTVVNDRQQPITNDNERETPNININSLNNNDLNTNTDTDRVQKIRKSKETRDKEREERFDRFYKSYPRHTNKQAARKAFDRLDPDEDLMDVMLKAIEQQKASPQWREGDQYIPHPSTWLNNRRWEDEEIKAAPRGTVTAQQYSQRDYSHEQEEAMQRMIDGADLIQDAG